MYIRIALVSLLLLGVGCTRTATPNSGAGSQLGVGPNAVDAAGGLRWRTAQPRHLSYANLPDRGDLVAYPALRVVKHDGAYTWHRAGLSEDHALSAVGGVMKITTPAGESLQFQYERHVEHPSGDWTWIGRSKGGAASDEVILTFGEKAAFGSISQPGKAPLKLTMSGGVSWLIETDPSKIAGIDNPATRPRAPDFLIPPKATAAAAASMEAAPATALSATSESVQAAGTSTIDVLLGYTGGFAAAQGGQSQAVTRLYNMVETANQAYANSQLDARIRLVHAMQVNYPDNTANDSALEALTGFRAPSTRTTPDTAFGALRAAREQYGADLVSLVRQFNTPENDGCGIAWLIGGGQSGIDNSDEYFGYSVVSDGRDAGTDGKTYFCREETLAHELGHNMGSQHDRVSATVDGSLKYGAYPYSFGHKTDAAAGNFYTVMSYGDTGQTPYRIFSNPRSTFCSQPPPAPQYACGIDEQADNARSLSQTMPKIASFRSARAKVRNDFNGDGRADVYWRNHASGFTSLWTMNGASVSSISIAHQETDQRWTVLDSGDFNGDGLEDVFWRNTVTGQNHIHFMSGSQILAGSGPVMAVDDLNWKVVALADFDGDARTDIYWRNSITGVNALWVMDGLVVRSIHYVHREPDQAWKVVGSGDFNGDGFADIFWRHENTGQTHVHFMRGPEILPGSRASELVSDTAWKVAAINDFTGDGMADIYWRNSVTGVNVLWTMVGAVPLTKQYLHTESDQNWKVVNSGDYNGDGMADTFWRHQVTGQNHVHLMSGASVLPGSGAVDRVSDVAWKVTGT